MIQNPWKDGMKIMVDKQKTMFSFEVIEEGERDDLSQVFET